MVVTPTIRSIWYRRIPVSYPPSFFPGATIFSAFTSSCIFLLPPARTHAYISRLGCDFYSRDAGPSPLTQTYPLDTDSRRSLMSRQLYLDSLARALAEARAGSADALNRLFQDTRGYLMSIVARKEQEVRRFRLDPEDLVQDTLLKASCSIGSFRGETP